MEIKKQYISPLMKNIQNDLEEYSKEIDNLKSEQKQFIQKSQIFQQESFSVAKKEMSQLQLKELSVSELKQLKLEAENRLVMKKREFELINKMNQDSINNLLLHQDQTLIEVYKQRIEQEKKEKQKQSDIENIKYFDKIVCNYKFEKRELDLKDKNTYENYLKTKEEFYNKLKESEVTQLHQKLKVQKQQVQSKADLQSQEDYKHLNNLYYGKYSQFLYRQLDAEKTRSSILKNIAESCEMMKILQVQATINQPKLWKNEIQSKVDREKLKEYIKLRIEKLKMQQKIKELRQKRLNEQKNNQLGEEKIQEYDWKQLSEFDNKEQDMFDVVKEVDKYLLEEYEKSKQNYSEKGQNKENQISGNENLKSFNIQL